MFLVVRTIFIDILLGAFIPFLGTGIGAAFVFFYKKSVDGNLSSLSGASAGIMTSASVWSLLLPSLSRSEHLGVFQFFPAVSGFFVGMVSMLFLQKATEKLHERVGSEFLLGIKKKNLISFLAVTLHNIPEGMAVGAGLVSAMTEFGKIPFSALLLPIGIALQNIPEGAIVSLPVHAEGKKKGIAFLYGVLSGAVEPVATLATILLSVYIISVLPYFLSFAAGAMIYVVVTGLVCNTTDEKQMRKYVVSFAFGFSLMMTLDVVLG